MPYDGQSSFLPQGESSRSTWRVGVSMPYDGQSSFLHAPRSVPRHREGGVNALWRAIIISTRRRDQAQQAETRGCQCPMTGNHHFYKDTEKMSQMQKILCQCPMTGNHHFYCECRSAVLLVSRCVNALWRAIIISTLNTLWLVHYVWRVSMPYDGQSSFLPRLFVNWEESFWVSMPYDGQSSFLPGEIPGGKTRLAVCQCPMTGNHHFYAESFWR